MFESDGASVVGRRGMGLVRVPAGSRVRACLQSVAVEVCQTHWFDRQVLCGGLDCPACGTYAARLMVFAVVVVEVGAGREAKLLELTQAAWSRVRMTATYAAADVVPGLELELTRRGPRSGIVPDVVGGGGHVFAGLVSREAVLDALSVLFSLPSRRDEETAVAFVDRLRPAVLARTMEAISRVG